MLTVMAAVGILSGIVFAGVQRGIATGKRTRCASNLRMIALAAISYADDNNGFFPWGSRHVDGYEYWAWDFVKPSGGKTEAGVIWSGGYGLSDVLQCPSFHGNANWKDNPYTGYNYNCSYIGKVEGDSAKRKTPARSSQLEDPAGTAMFGDGEYGNGANKFMRAPKADRQNDASGASLREAGTQGFRHRGRTNIAFCDGHVEHLSASYLRNGARGYVSPGCGFISSDNSMYSPAKD